MKQENKMEKELPIVEYKATLQDNNISIYCGDCSEYVYAQHWKASGEEEGRIKLACKCSINKDLDERTRILHNVNLATPPSKFPDYLSSWINQLQNHDMDVDHTNPLFGSEQNPEHIGLLSKLENENPEEIKGKLCFIGYHRLTNNQVMQVIHAGPGLYKEFCEDMNPCYVLFSYKDPNKDIEALSLIDIFKILH